MIDLRTDGPDLVEARIQKLLIDLANRPIELPSLLHRMAALLELAAIQLRQVESGERRVVWDAGQREEYRMRTSLEHWVQGIRFSDSRRSPELDSDVADAAPVDMGRRQPGDV